MYKVEAIVDKKINSRTRKPLYLVKWEGFHSDQNTWEPIDHLTDYCMSMIEQFQQKLKAQENIEINLEGNESKESKTRMPMIVNKQKIKKKNRPNLKKNKRVIIKQRDSEKENNVNQQQKKLDLKNAAKQNSDQPLQGNQEEELRIQSSMREQDESIQLKLMNSNKLQWQVSEEKAQNMQSNKNNLPIVLDLTKDNQPTKHKSSQGHNKFWRSFQRVKRDNQSDQGLRQQASSHNNLLNSYNALQVQRDQKLLSMHQENQISRQKIFGSEVAPKKEKIQILGLRHHEGVLSFYVQVKTEPSNRVWKSHEQMLQTYARELCAFYQQNIEFD